MSGVLRCFLVLCIGVTAAAISLVTAVWADVTVQRSPWPEILLSRQLMEQTGARVGDLVTLAGDSRGSGARQFRVAAQYEPTPDPLRFSARRLEARLHLPDLVALTADPADPLSSESVSAINLRVADPTRAGATGADISAGTPGIFVRRTSSQSNGGRIFVVVERFHWAIAVVTVVGSTAFLLALMVIRAEERRDIIGILRLMGIPPRSILIEVLFEGLLITLAGAVFGIIVALLGQGVVNRFFQWRYDTTLEFVRVTVPIALQSIAFAVPLGVLAGLVASWTLLRSHVLSLIGR